MLPLQVVGKKALFYFSVEREKDKVTKMDITHNLTAANDVAALTTEENGNTTNLMEL